MLFEKQFVPADKYEIWNRGWTAGNNKIAAQHGLALLESKGKKWKENE